MFFPIMLDIEKFNILVVGGGKIAGRKIEQLLKYKASPQVIAKEFSKEILQNKEKLKLVQREFKMEDLKGRHIVFAATNNKKLNEEIAKYCQERSILVNSVDNHENSSFINMSFFETEIEDNQSIVAVSSMGKNPKQSKKIKNLLYNDFERGKYKI